MAKDNGRLSPLDRLIAQALGGERVLGAESDPAAKDYPQLWRWLTLTTAGPDHVKQPATITIRMGPEGVLATLTDRDMAASVDVACLHLSEVYAALEKALNSGITGVRSWGKSEPKLRKRKPRS